MQQNHEQAHSSQVPSRAVAPDVSSKAVSLPAIPPFQLQKGAAAIPNNTGLPDPLKSGIEALSGVSMDDVKVHYNSGKPAQLQALAYAQGTAIHVAPGQERHLAHEAWHVVQQKQGKVQPTTQLKAGTLVNDDAGLEREADIMGEKALQPQVTETGRPHSIMAIQSAEAPVQRKVGFEFETDNKIAKEYRDIIPLKAHLWDDKGGFWHIQNDDNKLEFVTEPFDDINAIPAAISQMTGLIKHIISSLDKEGVYEAKKANGWNYDVKINIKNILFYASPQSTEGVHLENIPAMLKEHLPEDAWTAINEKAGSILPGKSEDDGSDGPPRGLLYAILSLFNDLLDETLKPSDMGPKQLLTMMHRTDFRSMYLSLTEPQRLLFKGWVKGGNPNGAFNDDKGLMNTLKKKWTDRIYAKPYHGALENPARKDKMWPGDSFREFFDSIWSNPGVAGRKDSQSPPAGYTAHHEIDRDNQELAKTKQPLLPKYAMGTHGMVEGRALFEMRGYGMVIDEQARFKGVDEKDNDIPYTAWEKFAISVFSGAAVRDKALKTKNAAAESKEKEGSSKKYKKEELVPK